MKPSAIEAAIRISRALIAASNQSRPTRSWSPSLEQTLHRLGCHELLSPSLVARVIDPFLLHHHSLALGFFYWASQKPGFAHTSISYQSVLKSLSISRQFNAVERLLKDVKAQKIVLDSSVYRSVIASHIIGKRTQNAFLIFNEVSALSREIGPDTCNSLVAALASDGCVVYAQRVFDEMIHHGVPLNSLGFGVFIWRFCRNAELGTTLSLLDEVIKHASEINGSIIALLIIHGLCQVSRVSEAFELLEELRSREYKPDFMAYRIVTEAFRLKGSLAEVEKVLKKKRKLGVAPRENDYREFIFVLISERRIPEAKELGEVIINGNFPIGNDVLNALAGRVREAYGVLQEMKKNGLDPDISSYNCLMEACCREDLLRPAKRLWDEMFASGYGVNLKTYNILIQKFSEIGQIQEAQWLFQHMLEKGVNPDATTYTSLLEGLCQEKKFESAFEVFKKSVEQDVMLAQTILNTFILYICKEGNFLFASKLLCGLTYDVGHSDSHVIFLKYLADASEISTAIEHIKWVGDTLPSMLPTISTELFALLASSSKPEPILQMLLAMQEKSPLPYNDSWKELSNQLFTGHSLGTN
ncbi:pentatricopeptide repeat-containing protein At5g14080 isoform X2 [Vitis vinifera]|uniref:pentatricopeptide repeat-containing protein At5g14080 isoform X2 n=1 Tax=Vitis vinifera TaxID=29760 RepID=UPI00288332DF|nr:pentatricopeptide repeat-containing protein At5g14080 isoform X2 [Vitis vinifera]